MIGEDTIIFGREPYPLGAKGPRAGRKTHRLPARSRAPAKPISIAAQTTARCQTTRDREVWRPDVARRRPIGDVGITKKPAAIFRAGSVILR